MNLWLALYLAMGALLFLAALPYYLRSTLTTTGIAVGFVLSLLLWPVAAVLGMALAYRQMRDHYENHHPPRD